MLVLSISEKFISIGIWICTGIYHVAAWTFKLFLVLSSGQVVDSSLYSAMLSNAYIILGILMLFVIAFGLLRSMVNPDENKGTESAKKFVLNFLVSTFLIAILPTIFGFAYDFQTSFITRYNVVGRFFGYGSLDSNKGAEKKNSDEVREGSNMITNGVFTAFFNVDTDKCDNILTEDITLEDIITCQNSSKLTGDARRFKGETVATSHTFYQTTKEVEKYGTFGNYIAFSSLVDDDEMYFNWFLCLIGGIMLVYVGASFCFDMGLRLVKLVFYQLIAPLPILFRMHEKTAKIFSSWLKITATCYFEVYIRIFAIYFCVYLCKAVLASEFMTKTVMGYGWFIRLFGKAFVLMGIVMFMKEAPKLISEVTGIDSGNMKLGIKQKLKDGGFFTAGAAIGGGVTAAVRNTLNAAQNGHFNFRENYNRAMKENGGKRFKAVLSSAGRGIRGTNSIIAGGASGTYRGGKGGANAANFSDMKKAAGTAAAAAVDARDIRANYRAKHGDTLKGVAVGRFKDAVEDVGRWAGLNNVEYLERENAKMDNVVAKVDNVAKVARERIQSNMKTGKNFTYGLKKDAGSTRSIVVGQDADGNDISYNYKLNYSLKNARMLEDLINNARADGEDKDISLWNDDLGEMQSVRLSLAELERLNNQYMTDYSEAVANQAFLSEDNYKKVVDPRVMKDYKEIAEMDLLRGNANEAREELGRVMDSEAVKRANKAAFDYAFNQSKEEYLKQGRDEAQATALATNDANAKLLNSDTINGDLRITDRTALNYYGSSVKQVKAENETEIAKVRRKEQEKKEK